MALSRGGGAGAEFVLVNAGLTISIATLALPQLRRYAAKVTLYATEKSLSLALGFLLIATFSRVAFVVDPEGAFMSVFDKFPLLVFFMIRLAQLCIILTVVLVIFMWRRMLRSHKQLKRASSTITVWQKIILGVMAVMMLSGGVTFLVDFGESGNTIAAWITW